MLLIVVWSFTCTGDAVAAVSSLTRALEGAVRVGAVGVLAAVVRFQCALVLVHLSYNNKGEKIFHNVLHTFYPLIYVFRLHRSFFK